ncbi:MAG: hypothetical protein P8Y76_15855 [bacterium]
MHAVTRRDRRFRFDGGERKNRCPGLTLTGMTQLEPIALLRATAPGQPAEGANALLVAGP